MAQLAAQPPFALFLRRELWAEQEERFAARYGSVWTRAVSRDGSRIVVEVTY